MVPINFSQQINTIYRNMHSCLTLGLLAVFFIKGILSSVLVYADAGTSSELIDHLIHSLQVAGEKSVHKIMADQLIHENWMNGCKMLIIPAGRDLEFVRLLNGGTIQKIQEFVKSGGSYMGICGGAYFASGRVEFEPGSPMAVVGSRELAFYPGTAFGSAYKPFTYSLEDMRAAAITMKIYETPGRIARFYHMGGCVFDHNEVAKYGWDTVASYADVNGSAIIGARIGRGKVLLSCPHIEFDSQLPSQFSHMKWHQEISLRQERRRKVFNFLMAYMQPDNL